MAVTTLTPYSPPTQCEAQEPVGFLFPFRRIRRKAKPKVERKRITEARIEETKPPARRTLE
jgi:hypothetical protein